MSRSDRDARWMKTWERKIRERDSVILTDSVESKHNIEMVQINNYVEDQSIYVKLAL